VLLDRAPWFEASNKVFLSLSQEDRYGFLAASSITDVYYLLRKSTQDIEKAKSIVFKLLTHIDVIDVNRADCDTALASNMGDFEDAVLAHSANRHGMDVIVTRNAKHFRDSPVLAISPAEYNAI
jgi:predicted nucleic acid-binding protein